MSQQFAQQSPAEFAQTKSGLSAYCNQTGVQIINLADITPGSPNATIKCSDIATATSSQDLGRLIAIGIFDQIYYKQYTCDLLACLSQLPEQDKFAIMVSAYANSTFKQAVMFAAGGIVLGIILIILGIRKLFRILRAIGVEVAIVGAAGYIGMNVLVGNVPAQVMQINVISDLLASLSSSFMVALVVGIVLTVVGFVGAHFVGREKPKPKGKKK